MKKKHILNKYFKGFNWPRVVGMTVALFVIININSDTWYLPKDTADGFGFIIGNLLASLMFAVIFEYLIIKLKKRKSKV